MEAKDLRQKSPAELKALAAELTGEIRDLRSSVRTRQTRNVRELRLKRRDLARVKTLQKTASETANKV
jgi:ribosomal protein L29